MEYHEILASLNKKKILFLGAGMSINSDIPVASKLYNSLWDIVKLDATEKEFLSKNAFSFEHFIHILVNNNTTDNFFSIFNSKSSSDIHSLINYLVNSGLVSNIITTNFDTLIEDSILGKKVNVYVNEDILKANLKSTEVNVFKIHGCVKSTDSLKITIERVAQRENSELLQAFFQKISIELNEEECLFLGYSFSDHYDVNVGLREYLQHKRIRIIYHTSEIWLNGKINLQTPAFDFSDRNIIIHPTNTDALLYFLLREFKIESKNPPPFDWKIHLKKWIEEEFNRDLIGLNITVAGIFIYLGNFKAAARLHTIALKTADDSSNTRWMIGIRAAIIGNHIYLSELDKAESLAHETIALSKTLTNASPFQMANVYMNLSAILLKQERLPEALMNCYSALDICSEYKFKSLYYDNYCNLGLILNKMNNDHSGEVYIKEATTYAKNSGDMAALSRRLALLAEIYAEKGNKNIAFGYINAAIELAVLVGEKSRMKLFAEILEKIGPPKE